MFSLVFDLSVSPSPNDPHSSSSDVRSTHSVEDVMDAESFIDEEVGTILKIVEPGAGGGAIVPNEPNDLSFLSRRFPACCELRDKGILIFEPSFKVKSRKLTGLRGKKMDV